MKTIKRISILAAAVGALALTGSYSQAQYRIETGRALDANNRLGSGGLNDRGDSRVGQGRYTGVTANDIVTGNVTAGKEFRGHVPYTESRAFRGDISRPSDSFIRGSAGTPYTPYSNNAQRTQAYYGDALAVPPPAGFVRQNVGSSGYVPGPAPERLPSDVRMGDPIDSPTILLPQPGQTLLPGQVDPSTNYETLITASSLYGVRQWNAGNESDQRFVSQYANVLGENLGTRMRSDLEVGAMRRELEMAVGGGRTTPQSDTLAGQTEQQQPGSPGQPLGATFESPNNAALPANRLDTNLQSNALPGGLETGAGVQARVIVPAARQSKANEILQRVLDERRGVTTEPRPEEQAREYNQQLKAMQDAQQQGAQPGVPAPGAPVPGQPGAQPGVQPVPVPVPGPTGAAGEQRKPPQIKSFAEGVPAKGLADVLQQAEDLMKQKQWTKAIDQYEVAQRVAPNNMLILVGRANAELGGSYYKLAEAHLRQAFTNDQAMLQGQYDLRGMIGEERLQFLIKELKDMTNTEQDKSMAPFLLAYIAYNTGNERMAAAYLKLADDRAPDSDTFYSLVRRNWTLPPDSEVPAPELNK